jgi:hypothetical protein
VKKELPSRDFIASVLEYNAETGVLRWKVSTSRCVRVGQVAGSVLPNGYLYVGIGGRRFLAHRIIWLLTNGEWPAGLIDHINGQKCDNRIANLRVCSHAENTRNSRTPRNNTSGVKGVSWDNAKKAWDVGIRMYGRNIRAGSFKDFEEAKRAIVELRQRLHGEFANHGTHASGYGASAG